MASFVVIVKCFDVLVNFWCILTQNSPSKQSTMFKIFRILSHTYICFILLISPLYAAHSSNQLNVLAIHSYHQDYPWTSSQYEAFKKQLKINLPEYVINFSTEYLDTKRITPSPNYQKQFLNYLNAKYGNNRPDLIYVTDDNALNFIHSKESIINWDIPIIFSGINNVNIQIPADDKHPLNGVFEYKDILSSISLAQAITKNGSNRIIFLGDGGTTDKAIKETINVNKYKKEGLEIIHLSYSNLDNLINKLNAVGKGTVILTTIGRVHDNQNILLDLKTTIKAITNTGRKILVMEDSYLFPGILGGYVNSGRIQGVSAANIASEMIQGEKTKIIENQSSSEFILSWPDAERFNMNLNDTLLKKATIINLPPPLIEQYPQITKWLLWFVSILIIIIFGFILNTRRKNIQLKEQYTDSVTGLPNRIKLLSDINKNNNPCLIIIDIKNFKSINNLYGLKTGDKLLRDFGKKINHYIDNKYTVYRSGGNQFAILSNIEKLKDSADDRITKLLRIIRNNSYHIGDIDINLTLTAGVSKNEHAFLIPRAEQALQEAKEKNKNYIIFDNTKENSEQHHKNILLAQKLNIALSDNRIIPFFQVIEHNKTGKKDKFEALVRLVDEDEQIILPSFFLDTAKSTRQYASLTKVMIEKTFKAIGDQDISISINFTVEDIRNEKTIKFFKEKLKEYNVAEKIIVELTETEGIENYSEVSNFIHDIKKIGCRVAIDDFGTGYSNFTHLIHLNVDYLKIDGSIIKNILKDKNAEIVAKTLVDFARQLGIETVAEYVESQEILDKVKELNIDYSQGYFINRPQKTLSA